MWAKQSTAATIIVGPILDSAGVEFTTAVIGELSISKNGGTLTAMAAAATLTHIANGQYTLVMTTGNLDTLGRAQITCNKVTYQMPTVNLMVVPAMVFDSMVLGTDVLQADVTQWLGTAAATPTVAGVPEVDVTHLLGTAWLTPGVAGTPDVNTKTITAGAINAAAIATDAIDSDAIATSAVTEIQAGLATPTNITAATGVTLTPTTGLGNQTANITGTITTATNVTTVNGLAAGVITAASIATNAIDADAIATDAINEIAAAVWTDSDIYIAGTKGSAVAAILVDTNELQTDWVNGGRLDLILDIIAVDTTTDIPALIAAEAVKTAAIQAVTVKLDTGLVLDGVVYQWTTNALELAPSGGGGGGDATLANQVLILDQLDVVQAQTDLIGSAAGISALLAAAVLEPGTITDFPETLTIGDSYTDLNGRSIQIPIVDTDGTPISSTGSLDFADADVTFVIKRIGETDDTRIITGSATFTDPPGTGTGAGAPYAVIELTALETAKGLIGYKYSGVLTFTWPGTGSNDEVMSFETDTIQFDG